jgi:hypothetical protein
MKRSQRKSRFPFACRVPPLIEVAFSKMTISMNGIAIGPGMISYPEIAHVLLCRACLAVDLESFLGITIIR